MGRDCSVMPRYYRKVWRIRAEDSPNVRLAMAEKAVGKEPSGKIVVPGVLPWADYVKRRATWDQVRQCIGLDAEFWEGADSLLFPPEWLNRAERLAQMLPPRVEGKAIGVDPAEGGDHTCICAVDELGVLELLSLHTPNTSVIKGEVHAAMRRWQVGPDRVVFDRGGGGKQIADEMRSTSGLRLIRTVAFGEAVLLEPKAGVIRPREKMDNRETRYSYVNRRAQMYGDLRVLMDPAQEAEGRKGFAIPTKYPELRRQLSPIPLMYDAEGRLKLPPKNKRSVNSTETTLRDLIGCSPDEADSLVLAVHGMLHRGRRVVAGVA